MLRRTFLKAVFAAAVAPASVVKCLYQPTRPGLTKTSCGPGWFEYYEGDKLVRRCPLSEELLRTGAKLAKFQPPGRRCIM